MIVKKKDKKVQVLEKDLLELIYWARRYCDGRSTYAPSSFNQIYLRVTEDYPNLKDTVDDTLTAQGKFWPWAQDGMYEDGFNSIPLNAKMRSFGNEHA